MLKIITAFGLRVVLRSWCQQKYDGKNTLAEKIYLTQKPINSQMKNFKPFFKNLYATIAKYGHFIYWFPTKSNICSNIWYLFYLETILKYCLVSPRLNNKDMIIVNRDLLNVSTVTTSGCVKFSWLA